MFFFKLVRTSGQIRLENYLYSQERFLIVPIISPASPAGEALLNDENLLLISEAFDRANADLIYVRKDDPGAYARFIAEFLCWAHKVAGLKAIKDPVIVIKTPNEWELFVISGLKESDRDEVKKTLWGIASCISSKAASHKLKNFIKQRNLSSYYSKNADLINSMLGVMNIAVKLMTGSGPK